VHPEALSRLLPPDSRTAQDLEAQHSIAYVLNGSATVNGNALEQDSAAYCKGALPLSRPAGTGRSCRAGSSSGRIHRTTSRAAMEFRRGCACRAASVCSSSCPPRSGSFASTASTREYRAAFASWYEEGSYPLVSTSDPGETADLLRGVVFPPEYSRYPDTAVWIEGKKSCESDWKSYAQTVVTLS
jgi:hypothetical protein